jgi:hypothetical protein
LGALHPTKAFNRNGTFHESGCGAYDVALLALVLYHQVTMLSDIGSAIRTDLLNETALPVRRARDGRRRGGPGAGHFALMTTAMPNINSGRLRALAVTANQRSKILPDLPTIAEAGVPGYEANSWYGLVVTANTPAAVIARLNKEVVQIVEQQCDAPRRGTVLDHPVHDEPGGPDLARDHTDGFSWRTCDVGAEARPGCEELEQLDRRPRRHLDRLDYVCFSAPILFHVVRSRL